ncbi:gustatory receptor for sugar taste 64e-like [Galleria mellonella]|uniref:Gustatory receptor for sugar taste 64e-like n=1 Tax=Galleria mellonella TaxID=7137 RepID=A0ABM3MQM5_GALME|nr:gustatory receptor for sugar taste 64e-like [Galleria mellonella]
MHNCLRRAMRLCRWMGFFPIEGLDQSSFTKLSMLFSQLAFRCFGKPDNISDFFEKYYSFVHVDYFKYIPYNVWIGVLLQIANIQAIFLWCFSDVLLMSVSTYLVTYFQILNKIIYTNSSEKKKNWKRLRLLYSRAAALISEVDSHMSSMCLVTFFVYLYFTCWQLYNTIHDIRTVYRAVYYIYSTIYLIVRCFVTSLMAANINIVARKPLVALYDVPSSEYSIEVQRFQMQIKYAPVALSGVSFNITRKTILNVISTITTYELVMLQLPI